MAKIKIAATRTVEQTKTVEVKVRIGDVKEWLRDNYGTYSEHGLEWNDQGILEEYFESVEDCQYILNETKGHVDENLDHWELELVEETNNVRT